MALDIRFYIAPSEAARRLGVSRQRVVHLTQSGHLTSVQTARGQLIDPDMVARLAKRRHDATRPATPFTP
jgi:excisionase family DNA binding protein